MDRVLGAVTVMIPTSVKFGESKEGAVNSIQEEMSIETEGSEEEEMESKPYIEPDYSTGCSRKNKDTGAVYAHNRIVFGAPGTGKSFKLNDEQKMCIRDSTDREHMHGHLIWNSVSMTTGKKYNSPKSNWKNHLQPIDVYKRQAYDLVATEICNVVRRVIA